MSSIRRNPSRVRFTDGGLIEPAIEVSETDDEVCVTVEVPGIHSDDLHVTACEDRVIVRAEARRDGEDQGKTYYLQELPYGFFERTVPLPVDVDPTKATATLEHGVLEISLPKDTRAAGRPVPITLS